MNCRIKILGVVAAILACAFYFDGRASPSWSELGSEAASVSGGTSCWTSGTQTCPCLDPACTMRYGPSCPYDPNLGFYHCTVTDGDVVGTAYPPKAIFQAQAGYKSFWEFPDTVCATKMYCQPVCVLKNGRYECQDSFAKAYCVADFSAANINSGACDPAEE
jgi:hypothetical protein